MQVELELYKCYTRLFQIFFTEIRSLWQNRSLKRPFERSHNQQMQDQFEERLKPASYDTGV